jgi:hypothetical protein
LDQSPIEEQDGGGSYARLWVWVVILTSIGYIQQDTKKEGMKADHHNYPLNFKIIFDNN